MKYKEKRIHCPELKPFNDSGDCIPAHNITAFFFTLRRRGEMLL